MIGREFDHPEPVPLCRNLSSSLYMTERGMVYKREREREILRVASSVTPVFVSLPGPVVATLLRGRVHLTVRSVEWDMRR